MYEAIIKRLDILLEDTKKKSQQHKLELDIRQKEAEAKRAAEDAKHSKNKLKKERAALKKAKKERQLLDSQKDAEDAAWQREEAERKLKIQEAQHLQQQALQASFEALEIKGDHHRPSAVENTDTVSAQQQMETLLNQINNNELDRNDPKIKEQLQALLKAIAGL